MSINWLSVEGQIAQYIFESIDEDKSDKLDALTAEELFYVWKILQHETKPYCKPDVFLLVQKKRVQEWMRGKRPHHGMAFKLFQKMWQEEFFDFLNEGV